jgi:hypothetical protein
MDKQICMSFKFIDEFANVEYQETIQTNTDSYGMVNLIIGTDNKQVDTPSFLAKLAGQH